MGNLIKDIDPHLYKEYILHRYKSGETGRGKSRQPEFKFEQPKFKPRKTTIHLPSIGSLPKRTLSEGIMNQEEYQQFLWTESSTLKILRDAQSVCQVDYSNLTQGEPRLVIPFFDENNKLIGPGSPSGNPKYDMLL